MSIPSLKKVGWKDVPLVAMETVGADCFNKALKAGEVVALPTISSLATSLGALQVSQKLFDFSKKRRILSEVVTDKQAVEAVSRFADDHRMLVEPSCGAALAAVYAGTLQQLQRAGKLAKLQTAVIVVCGGYATSLAQLNQWKKQVGLN